MKGSLKACFHWQWIWTQSFSWSGKSTYDPVKMEKKSFTSSMELALKEQRNRLFYSNCAQ